MAGRVEADPRLIEEAVRAVSGVAFAEVHTGEGEGLLTLVLWQGVDPGECAYRIETLLRDRFEIELRPNDLQVVGYATPRADSAPTDAPPFEDTVAGGPPPPELRVIELDGVGGTTWATEPIRPTDTPLPSTSEAPPAPALEPPTAGPAAPAGPSPAEPANGQGVEAGPAETPPVVSRAPLEERSIIAALEIHRVVVAEGNEVLEVRVELRAGDRTYAGEASGPATATRKQRSLCHATLRAVSAALPEIRLDLDHAAVVELPEPAVVVVITRLDATGERRLTGAALAGRDTATAFVRATLAALR